MRTTTCRLLVLTLTVAGTGAWGADSPKDDTAVAAALRAHVEGLAARGSFSGAVLLAKGDQVLLREAYGLAARASGRPNRPETRFNLGSINKAFTRIAVEQLAAAGKLALGDTLERWVPEYTPARGRGVTLGQLLEHRAGTGDFFGPRYDAYDRGRLRALRDWLPLIQDQPLRFEPGRRQEYSNAGYLLLGLVIERATGQSYYDYVRERVFAPAGMRDSASYELDALPDDTAVGYTTSGGASAAENRAQLPGRGSSAGGGYSTVDDLLRFAQALRAGRLGLPKVEGGLGVAGGAPGVNAVLEMTGDYTLVVLSNLDPPAAQQAAAPVQGWLPQTDGRGAGQRVRIRKGAAQDRPGSTRLPAGAAEVPMLRSAHLPAVQVKLNGQGPFLFAIDTGGAGSARIDSALAARLGLTRVGEVRSGDPSGKNARTVPVVALDSLEIGSARFLGLTATLRDSSEPLREHVDGVLGFGLFAECLLTLDFPGNVVRLETGELPPANGRDVLAYTDEHGVPSVALQVAGRELRADVDVGAMGGLSLPEAAAATLPLSSPLRVVGQGRTESNSFEIKAAELDGDASVGALAWHEPTLEFQPLFPMANLGARVLSELVLSFDQRNRRLRLRRPGGA